MTRQPHAVLEGVTRVYPGTERRAPLHALGPIDLTVHQGEFLAVVGPSGCGKSTLLELLAGLQPLSEGRISFEGQAVDGRVPDGIGVVFQQDASFPWLTVRDNIAFGLRHADIDASTLARRVEDALGLMGLREFAGAYPAQLSGGMRQRVCIARTLVMEPRLILLDEPFGSLDQQTRLLMGDELLKLWRATGATVLLITHALDEAAMLADRIAVMSARPGRFLDVVETRWPKNRDSRLVESASESTDLARITARLWSHLRVESMKAMGENGSTG